MIGVEHWLVVIQIYYEQGHLACLKGNIKKDS